MTFSEQFKEIFELICEKIGVVIDWSQEKCRSICYGLFKAICCVQYRRRNLTNSIQYCPNRWSSDILQDNRQGPREVRI